MRRQYENLVWLCIIYLTRHITGKSRAMAVDGDGTLIAGIPEINLFCQHPLSRTSISLHLRSIAFIRDVCVYANIKTT